MVDISENTYKGVDKNIILYLYKNKNTLKKTATILNQGCLNVVKNYMSIDDVMATANALYDFKSLPLKQKEDVVKNMSVYDIINYSYDLKQGKYNHFSEIKANRKEGITPNELKSKISSKKKLTPNQKKVYELQMLNVYENIGLEERLNQLSEEEVNNFKESLLKPGKKIIDSKIYDAMHGIDNFEDKYVVLNKKDDYATLIANVLSQYKISDSKIKKLEEQKVETYRKNEIHKNYGINEDDNKGLNWKDLDEGNAIN